MKRFSEDDAPRKSAIVAETRPWETHEGRHGIDSFHPSELVRFANHAPIGTDRGLGMTHYSYRRSKPEENVVVGGHGVSKERRVSFFCTTLDGASVGVLEIASRRYKSTKEKRQGDKKRRWPKWANVPCATNQSQTGSWRRVRVDTLFACLVCFLYASRRAPCVAWI